MHLSKTAKKRRFSGKEGVVCSVKYNFLDCSFVIHLLLIAQFLSPPFFRPSLSSHLSLPTPRLSSLPLHYHFCVDTVNCVTSPSHYVSRRRRLSLNDCNSHLHLCFLMSVSQAVCVSRFFFSHNINSTPHPHPPHTHTLPATPHSSNPPSVFSLNSSHKCH